MCACCSGSRGASAPVPHCWRGARAKTNPSRAWRLWASLTEHVANNPPPPPPHTLSAPLAAHVPQFVYLCVRCVFIVGSCSLTIKRHRARCLHSVGLFRTRLAGGRSGCPGWDSAVCHGYIRKVAVSFFRSVSPLQRRAMRHRGGYLINLRQN